MWYRARWTKRKELILREVTIACKFPESGFDCLQKGWGLVCHYWKARCLQYLFVADIEMLAEMMNKKNRRCKIKMV